MKPDYCIQCEVKRPMPHGFLCYGCHKLNSGTDFQAFEAQLESNARYGFDVRPFARATPFLLSKSIR